MPPSNEQLLSMYRSMLLLRRFEERAGQAYGLKKIQGFCHLYIGQEAVVVGANAALRQDDYMLTGYRDHAHILARGADPRMVMAELYGRTGGYSKGKGGSMHLIDVEHHFYGGYGIVGAQIPMGAGMAFASKYRGEDRVTACFFGDAAANQGAFHETLNMAAKWALPIIFVCENNRYGMGTDIARVSGEPRIHKRASAYRMRGEEVDGKNVLTLFDAVTDCVAHCRQGKGPVLLEAMTYRFRGHSMSDAATYRTKDEVEEEKRNDPILTLRAHLLAHKLALEPALAAIDDTQKAIVDAALAFAEASPEPAMDELYTDVTIAPGEADTRPRARVLGATDVVWPSYPSGQQLQVAWELEPRAAAPAVAAPPVVAPRKGAA